MKMAGKVQVYVDILKTRYINVISHRMLFVAEVNTNSSRTQHTGAKSQWPPFITDELFIRYAPRAVWSGVEQKIFNYLLGSIHS